MNIEKLNNCFDSMAPTVEQKEKMLARIMEAKTQPVKHIPLHRYISAAAAVVVIGAGLFVYGNLNKNISTEETDTPVAVNEPVKNSGEEYKYPIETKENTEKGKVENNTVRESYNSAHSNNNPDERVAVVTEPENNVKLNDFTENEEKANEVSTENEAEQYDLSEASLNEDESLTEEAEVSGGGGGGGSASGGAAFYQRKFSPDLEYTFEQLTSESEYANCVPKIAPAGFRFLSAVENNGVVINYGNEIGNYINITIFKKGERGFNEPIINPDDVLEFLPNGYVEFALDCGDYYAIYNAEAVDLQVLYEAVISAPCFE